MNVASDLVWGHLSQLPAFRALIRSIEHRLLSDHKPFEAPILDVGSGDGHFAAAALGPGIDLGIDIVPGALQEAKQRQVYRHLVCASATALPLGAESFATAISNCAVEHIPDLRSTLAEMYRVLRPGGKLLLTVPTNHLEENLLVPRALRAIKLDRPASSYVSWFRHAQVHYHTLSREQWVEEVTGAGFLVTRTRGYLSTRATHLFELGHYAGWHNLLSRKLTGRWVLWPWRTRFYLTERLLAGCVDEQEHTDDSCLFIVAHKQQVG